MRYSPLTDESPRYPTTVGDVRVERYLPLWIVLAWLGGTYLVFLSTSIRALAGDINQLSIFIVWTIAAVFVGYVLGVVTRPVGLNSIKAKKTNIRRIEQVIIASSMWFVAFGLDSITRFGVTDIATLFESLLTPGDSYQAKLEAYANNTSSAFQSLMYLAISLSGVLFALLVPYLFMYWRQVRSSVRFFAVVAMLIYLVSFASIGTMKGIGDLAIMSGAALLALSGMKTRVPHRNRRFVNTRLGAFLLISVGLVGFLALMAWYMSDRIAGQMLVSYYLEPDPSVRQIFGEKYALGLAAVLYYPTNGYVGLSHSLQLPFIFSGGASMPVYAQTIGQWFGIADPTALSLPVRVESLTGWSSTVTWSTLYAWLASDFDFWGAVVLMGVLGWMLARSWIGARQSRDPLALAMFGLLMIAFIYVPANNQLMMTRYTANAFLTLVVIMGIRSVGRLFRSNPGNQA